MASKRAAAQKLAGTLIYERELRAVETLLELCGEDPCREGLLDTPSRVVKSLREMTAGYKMDPAKILSKLFSEHADEMIWLRNIRFTSLCEHHMLPFIGSCTIAYIPSKAGVVGISKLARLVQCFALRLQVQERMTTQIAEAIETHLKPLGCGVVIKAHHCCMGCRGVRQTETEMITSCLKGAIKLEHEARAEFLGGVGS